MSDAIVTPLDEFAASEGPNDLYFNGTAVALDGHGALILGAPGSGKSSLALALLALGADLISDDGVWVSRASAPILKSPENAPTLIEARGIGLLPTGAVAIHAPLALVVNLDGSETERLPPRRMVASGGVQVPLILGAGQPQLWAPVHHILRHGPPAV